MKPNDYLHVWLPVMLKFYNPKTGMDDIDDLHSAGAKMDKDLGVDEFADYVSNPLGSEREMPDELRATLEKLGGPYGEALFKALKIRKEQNEDRGMLQAAGPGTA